MQARPTAMGSDSTSSRSGRQDPPLPDTDLAQVSGSNFLPNSALEPMSTGYVESLIRPQAEAAADDLLHDLGGRRRRGMSRQHAAVMQSAGAGMLDPPQAARQRGSWRLPPQESHGRNGTMRHTAARLLTGPC
jgi:hypothetical protein